jgi:hypothetical protein
MGKRLSQALSMRTELHEAAREGFEVFDAHKLS